MMEIESPQRDRFERLQTVELLGLAVWFALVASAGELAALGVQIFVLGGFIQRAGAHLLWMVPAGNAVAFVAVALAVAAVARVSRRGVSPKVALSLFAGLAACAVLLLLRRHVHWAAILLLAAGAGNQSAMLLARHFAGFRRLARWTLPAGIAVVLLAAAAIPASRGLRERRGLSALAAAPAAAPDILLIILDTVRSMSLGLDADGLPTTPNLARWARRGVVFERAIAPAPWTLPSHASMFTGRWADELPEFSRRALGPEPPVLTETLLNGGYATAGFVGNRVVNRASGLARGFLHFEVFTNRPSQLLNTPVLLRNLVRAGVLRRIFHYYEVPGRKNAAAVNDEFLRWTERHGERPFFAFLNYFDAHAPYLPPPPFDTQFDPRGRDHIPILQEQLNIGGADRAEIDEERADYEGALAYIDAQLGDLLDRMDRRGLMDSTVIIISSDHGEEIGEHGKLGHGHTLYTELLSVPLIVIAPGRVPAGVRITQPVSLVDVPSTILDLAGVSAPEFRGRSLRALWEVGRTAAPVWAQGAGGEAVIDGDYHYVLDRDSAEYLFDMSRDPLELRNLIGDTTAAAVLDRLRALVLLDPEARRSGSMRTPRSPP